MRLILIAFLSLLSVNSFSQKMDYQLQVVYQVYIDGDYPITYPALLHIKGNASIYQLKTRLRKQWSGSKNDSEDLPNALTARITDDDYLKINHATKELLFFDRLATSKVFITDNYPNFEWLITDETKKISGYKCIKATTEYRGRNWVAWFTADISIPYGPWKLHGLPGLILEAYSFDKKYTMKAVKIEQIGSDIFDQEFSDLVVTRNKKPITYKQFLEDSLEEMENMVKKMNSDGENVELIIPPRSGYELRYEWEE